MSKSPTVSWLLGVKNGMPYLPETLASIESQTYSDFEVLAWDNGSEDETVEVLTSWIPSRLPGKVFSGDPLSFAESKAALIARASSEFLANIDADDVNLPERLAEQVTFMNANPGVAAASCHFQRIDESGNQIGPVARMPLTHPDIVNKLLDPSPLCNPGAIMRTNMVKEVGSIRNLPLGEDYDLWLRLANRYHLGNVDMVGLNYRVRPDSMINVAKRTHTLTNMTADVAAIGGVELFGLDSDLIKKLFMRETSYALPFLIRIARHLDQTQIGPNRLRSKSFVRAIRNLVSRTDSRTWLAIHSLRLFARD